MPYGYGVLRGGDEAGEQDLVGDGGDGECVAGVDGKAGHFVSGGRVAVPGE